MNSLLKYKLLLITLLSIGSITTAQAHVIKVSAADQAKIQIISVAREQNKLLPKALYVQTRGHTFKRKFAIQNRVVKNVYYDASQATHQLYTSITPQYNSTNLARSYWP